MQHVNKRVFRRSRNRSLLRRERKARFTAIETWVARRDRKVERAVVRDRPVWATSAAQPPGAFRRLREYLKILRGALFK